MGEYRLHGWKVTFEAVISRVHRTEPKVVVTKSMPIPMQYRLQVERIQFVEFISIFAAFTVTSSFIFSSHYLKETFGYIHARLFALDTLHSQRKSLTIKNILIATSTSATTTHTQLNRDVLVELTLFKIYRCKIDLFSVHLESAESNYVPHRFVLLLDPFWIFVELCPTR